ncbi:hypothetical protein [Enhygromyxa salina]|uniref:hypothetical protein n=1 Tax=Enhygromyxa salina TaxID=215803 RepID=UPI0011BAB129|nr:hypothetical protein [Enhygromyxa salina]
MVRPAIRPRLIAGAIGFVVIAGLVAGPGVGSALAANEAHVRTPVLWPAQCGRVVDRSVDPIARFEYAIPAEDTTIGPDELPDSRTHQFVAVCRQHPLTELLPGWITRDDVERSVELGLLEANAVTSSEILDETTVWAGCFTRITADDERRPISFAQAASGVEWDTSAVERGVWSIAGYTFEPALNLWRERPGFVKVVDDPRDPEQDLPALALLGQEQVVAPGDAIVLEACVDAHGPAEVTIEWAPFAPSLIWQPLATITASEDGPLAVDLVAPAAAADSQILIRARIVDALGREYVGHAPARVSVLPCPDPDNCVDPVDPVDPVEPADSSPAPAGCSISSQQPRGLLFTLALLLAWLRVRSPKPEQPTRSHARAQQLHAVS